MDSINQNDATARYLKGEYIEIGSPVYESTQSHIVRPITEREQDDVVFKRAISSIERLAEFHKEKLTKSANKKGRSNVSE